MKLTLLIVVVYAALGNASAPDSDSLPPLFPTTVGTVDRSDAEALLPPLYAYEAPNKRYVTHLQGLVTYPTVKNRLAKYALKLVARKYGLTETGKEKQLASFYSKVDWFTAAPARGQEVARASWFVDKQTVSESLEENGSVVDDDGKYDCGRITLPRGVTAGSTIEYMVERENGKAYSTSQSKIYPVTKKGWTVVSDIDDTVRWTGVLATKEMLETTFIEPFRPMPGMDIAFRKLSKKLGDSSIFHYLSGSPIALLKPLADFLEEYKLPLGPMHLQLSTMDTLPNLLKLKNILEHKLKVLRELVKNLPLQNYIFIGDSTQTDPGAYGEIAREMAAKNMTVPCIYILATSGVDEKKEAKRNTPSRFRWDFREISADRWMVIKDPKELEDVDPSSGKCYPSGKVNTMVDAGDEGKPTKPMVDSSGKPITYTDTFTRFMNAWQKVYNLFRRLIKAEQ